MRTSWNFAIAVLLALAAPALAQGPTRIAWIWPGTPDGSAGLLSAFKTGMRENGMVEGKDYLLDERYAEGKYDRFPALVGEVLARDPAIILGGTIASVRAAQKATKTLPIVFVSVNDPVGSGLVASLARPGGNTTGLSSQNEDMIDKYLELLREILPKASRIAVLVNPGNPSGPKLFERLFVSARASGIDARAFDAATPERLDAAFDAIASNRFDALLVIPDATFYDQRNRISALAISHRFPAIVPQSEYVSAGCLISFGVNRSELYRRSAIYVKRILAGAKPGEIPVEQPTRFELTVNLKTAKALGITVPQSVLLRADEVIQ